MTQPLDTNLLLAFIKVAETGGTTSAGEALHLTQAAVSLRIRKLEERLGIPLFMRSSRGMRLTPSGNSIIEEARAMLALSDGITSRFKAATLGDKVRLGFPADLVKTWVSPLLKEFKSSYAHADLSMTTDGSLGLLQKLSKGELDIALVEEPAGNSVAVGRRQRLMTDSLVWVGAKGGVAFRQCPLPLSISCESSAFRPLLLSALRKSGLPFRTITEFGNSDFVATAVRSDLAVSALLKSTINGDIDIIKNGDNLPCLGEIDVNLYSMCNSNDFHVIALADFIESEWMNAARG